MINSNDRDYTVDAIIEKGIPIPFVIKQGILKSLLTQLEPGDSFLWYHHMAGSIALMKKQYPERKFKRQVNKATGKTRVWRVT